MGIKKLTSFLKTNFPELFHVQKWEDFFGKKVCFDVSIFMCKFKQQSNTGPKYQYLDCFLNLILKLRSHNVHPIFVFDGGYPDEKIKEKERRQSEKIKQGEKIKQLEKDILCFRETKVVSTLLLDVYRRERQREEKQRQSLLLRPKQSFSLCVVLNKLEKMKNNTISISPDDYKKLQELLSILRVPWLVAGEEAEKHCVYLIKKGIAEAVCSEDSDCLAYGASKFLCKPNFSNGTFCCIEFDDILDVWSWNREQFLDFCIMCGTDYNSNIRGIGVSKAFDLINTYKSIDSLPSYIDVSCLNFKNVRKLFMIFTKEEQVSPLPTYYTRFPTERLQTFCFRHSLRTSTNLVIKSFESSEHVHLKKA
jgi:5'-3' exonuclease